MPKKAKIHGNQSEIEKVSGFLNQDLGVLSKAVATQEAEELAVRRRFMNRDLSNLKIVWLGACDELKITQPDVDALMEFQSWLRLILAAILERDPPTAGLYHLVHGVNRRIHNKPLYLTWDLRSARGLPREDTTNTNLHLGDYSWRFETINTDGDFVTQVCHSIMRVLELDQLSLMAICRTCRRFFSKGRSWQKDCGANCKKDHDNGRSKTRKANRKAVQVLEVANKRLDLLKKKATDLLIDGKFVRKLDPGLSQRWRIAERLLTDLKLAKSEDEFWAATGRCRPIFETAFGEITMKRCGIEARLSKMSRR